MFEHSRQGPPRGGRDAGGVRPPVPVRHGPAALPRLLGNGSVAALASATGPAGTARGAVLQRCGDHPCPPDGCDHDLQRNAIGTAAAGPAGAVPASAERALRGAGVPLVPHVRALLEPRFGTSFAEVRVHTDAQSSRDVAAVAYTMGSHLVFAPGRYAPDTPAGLRLLAHELVHVVQQRAHPGRPQGAAAVSHPGGADEREADAVAGRVVAGGPAGPVTAAPSAVQRTVHDAPVETPKPNAQVCLVHLHGDEGNSRLVARDLQSSFCANLVDLTGSTRTVRVTGLPGGRATQFDPNRVFTPAGIAWPAFEATGATRRDAADAGPQVAAWVSAQLVPAISRCRGGGGTALTDGRLPVVAFHNNAGLSIRSYQRGGSEAHATEADPSRRRGGATSGPVPANPSRLPARSPIGHPGAHNFLLVTDLGDFTALRPAFNVVLQESTAAAPGAPGSAGAVRDDGSLSVALRADRYVNVEAFGKAVTRLGRTDPLFVENLAMGTDVLTTMGIPRTCPAPATGPAGRAGSARPAGAAGRAQRAGAEPDAGAPAASETAPAEPGLLERVVQLISRFIDELRRVLRQVSTSPEPLPREPVPGPPPQRCRVFADQAALDTAKARFASLIAGMADADVISWLVGVTRPPAVVTAEVAAQRDCMVAALRRAARAPGSPISMTRLPTAFSGYRSFADQQRIWSRKFAFTRGQDTFGRITDAARAGCPALGTAVEWNPDDPAHRTCWTALTAEQRQREILQTSSGPGTSRHHWGTDVDLWSTSPADFEVGGSLADEYSWLIRNASTYGFIQTFTPLSTFLRLGYTEERWHWSYHPAAQALLEWADSHRADLDARLRALWGGRSQFSFLLAHWEEFVFNVNQAGRF